MNIPFAKEPLGSKDRLIEKLLSYDKKVFIETGTYRGMAIRSLLAKQDPKNPLKSIKSCELVEYRSEEAKNLLENFTKKSLEKHVNPTIELFAGKHSYEHLPEMVKDVNEPAVFFLDAHPSQPEEIILKAKKRKDEKFTTPYIISSELEVILSHHVKGHVILIDDVYEGWVQEKFLPIFQKFNVIEDYNFWFDCDLLGRRRDKILFCEPK